MKLAFVILAAGVGKRMGGKNPKVLAKVRSKTLIELALENTSKLKPDRLVVVTGFGREAVETAAKSGADRGAYSLNQVQFAVQQQQLGTGDAVKAALPALQGFTGTVCIVYGDMPLLSTEIFQSLLETHRQEDAALTITTYRGKTHNQYGRVLRSADGSILKIVEVKDCTPAERRIEEVNVGLYAVESPLLPAALPAINNKNAQHEYYLTDIVDWTCRQGHKISALPLDDPAALQGVNTYGDLALVNRYFLSQRIEKLINAGVFIEDPETLYLDDAAEIEPGAVIGPQVKLLGRTTIAGGAVLEGNAWLKDTVVAADAVVKFGVRAEEAVIGAGAAVGPFAHLRSGSVLAEDVRVGNFVETKKTRLGPGAKASHLTYLGDATVGAGVNIGAGTITCNYDGFTKSETVIGDGAFIGSDTCLVAPVKVGAGATIGAGSVITKDIEPDALALTRAELKIKSGWPRAKREKDGGKNKH